MSKQLRYSLRVIVYTLKNCIWQS